MTKYLPVLLGVQRRSGSAFWEKPVYGTSNRKKDLIECASVLLNSRIV